MPKEIKTLSKERFGQVLKAAKYLKSVIPRLSDGYDIEINNGKLTVSEIRVNRFGIYFPSTIGIYKLSNSDADLSIV